MHIHSNEYTASTQRSSLANQMHIWMLKTLRRLLHAVPIGIVLKLYVTANNVLFRISSCILIHSHINHFLQYGKPTLDCDEFVKVEDCEANDDLDNVINEKNGGCSDEDSDLTDEPTIL